MLFQSIKHSLGRTLDFSLDLSKTPIIGIKFLNSEVARNAVAEEKATATPPSGVSLSRKPSNNQDIDSVWRRPQASQVYIFCQINHLNTR